jgi:uncharacterized membrane protein YebE (DUF533 family)
MMGSTLEALNLLLALMNSAMTAMASAARVSAIIRAAQAEGRVDLTPEEMAQIKGIDDDARKILADAITNAGP